MSQVFVESSGFQCVIVNVRFFSSPFFLIPNDPPTLPNPLPHPRLLLLSKTVTLLFVII